MKRITMINPNMASYRSGDAMQPLVFAILKSLTPPDFQVTFFDDRVEDIDFELPTDLVAISVGTFTARQSYKIAATYRAKGIPVVMGGYHATLLPNEAKQHADAVVVGNAEMVWGQVLDDFAQDRLKPFYNSEDNNQDHLKTSYDYSIFKGKKYFPLNLVEWGRGCRHNCDFCCIQAFNNRKETLRPIEDVMKDIKGLDNKPIFFVDDNLYHNKKQFKEFLKALIPLKRKWACQISVDVTNDDELLDLMQQSGCLMVLLGIESLRGENLKMMNKSWNFNPEKYAEALRKFKNRHIMIYGAFIFGYDHDIPEDFKNAVDFAIRNKLFIANFNPLYPMPGTPLYDRLEQEGRLLYEKWWIDPHFYYGKSMFNPVGISPEELENYCFNAKKQFNSLRSIFYRMTNLSANMYGKINPVYFIMANFTNRREVFKKQGKKLGESPKNPKTISTMKKNVIIMAIILTMAACGGQKEKTTNHSDFIPEPTVQQAIDALVEKHGNDQATLIQKGVAQAAALWREEDGTSDEFKAFCLEQYVGGEAEREKLFKALSRNFEALWGHNNQIRVELNKPLHLDVGELQPVDIIFAGYAPGAHFYDDFFKNKIAFITILNFPFYSLDEKASHASNWTRFDWASARLGDEFISREPATVSQEISRISTESDSYISDYNIRMGKLLDNDGNTLFPEEMSLITHWGLRDELKSNYGDDKGNPKQEMIYQVMLRIINQDIPEQVINNPEYNWNPFENTVIKNDETVATNPEPDTRYQFLLNNFKAHQQADAYHPNYPTYIERAFNRELELSMEEVEALFVELVSSPVLKDVGALISRRLGRDLRPYDIWYDGFKARSSISEESLDEKTRGLFPDATAFEKDLPSLLVKLGYNRDRANYISSKIVVEASRGAGHAWPAQMRSQVSRLRTRIPSSGMDYKGYNIAIHEFGHNVEQTISLYDVDHYTMSGVPNTAFTEAMAFIYQTRDLELLGIQTNEPNVEYLNTLDKLWGSYEIMGVSLVDMAVWRWMYDNPNATAAQLKDETIRIAMDVWNNYFAPVFGEKDSPILAIYSHMIAYPLYLSAYPIGRLIEFQIEQHIEGKNLATETDRMFTAGKLIPQEWMRNAVGQPISAQPMLNAAAEAVGKL